MTEMARRLERETVREKTPWEMANEPQGFRASWDYICRNGSYINREVFDYGRVTGRYA